MTVQRRSLLALAGLAPFTQWSRTMAAEHKPSTPPEPERLILSDFTGEEPVVLDGAGWRVFATSRNREAILYLIY